MAVFAQKETILFVGGITTKVGAENDMCGGCTKDYWGDLGNPSKVLSDVMSTNGEPKSHANAWNGSQNACEVVDNGSGKVRIRGPQYLQYFTDVEVGHIANIDFLADITDGRYEVAAVGTHDGGTYYHIDIEELSYSATTCDVKVGGAFDKLQNVIDNCDASNGYNVYIYDNKPETLTAAVDFDTTGGSIANNSQMIVEGFHTTPGDMNYEKTYYQGPLDCLINGVNTDKCVMLDADGGDYSVIVVDDFDGLVLKNFYFYNTDKESGHNCIQFLNEPVNIGLINCRFDKGYRPLYGGIRPLTAYSCYIGNDYTYSSAGAAWYPGVLINCVLNGEGKSYIGEVKFGVFQGCLFYKSTFGCYVNWAAAGFYNCIFYGQTSSCIKVGEGVYSVLSGYNNIFMPAAAADFVVYAASADGSVSDDCLRKSCVWTVAGVAMTNHISVNSITRQLSDVIEADPLFVDAANGDFRLKPNSPLINKGFRTIGNTSEDDDGYSTIGAWGRKSLLGVEHG